MAVNYELLRQILDKLSGDQTKWSPVRSSDPSGTTVMQEVIKKDRNTRNHQQG